MHCKDGLTHLHVLFILVCLLFSTALSQDPPGDVEIGLRLHSVLVRDDCEIIGAPSFHIRSTGYFDVPLTGVTTPNTVYELDLFLFWWPHDLPTITVEVFDDDPIGINDNSLGTVVLERNMTREYVVYYNTTEGDADCNFQTATIGVYYNETREPPANSTTSETEQTDDAFASDDGALLAVLVLVCTGVGIVILVTVIFVARCICLSRHGFAYSCCGRGCCGDDCNCGSEDVNCGDDCKGFCDLCELCGSCCELCGACLELCDLRDDRRS